MILLLLRLFLLLLFFFFLLLLLVGPSLILTMVGPSLPVSLGRAPPASRVRKLLLCAPLFFVLTVEAVELDEVLPH